MASLEDLRFQAGLREEQRGIQAQNKYQDAAKQASDLFLKGDIEGATGLLMKVDPQLAGQILGPLAKARQTPQLEQGVNPQTGKPEIFSITGAGKATATGVGVAPKAHAGASEFPQNYLDPSTGEVLKLAFKDGVLSYPDGSPVEPERAARLRAGFKPDTKIGPLGDLLSATPGANQPISVLQSSSFKPVEELTPEEINKFNPNKVQRNEFIKEQVQFRKLADPFKQTLGQLKDVEQSLNLAEEGNPLTKAALQKQVAKGVLKEVGNLAQHDTAGVTESQALYDSITQYIETLGSGNLTQDNIDFLRDMINAYKEKASGALQNEYKGFRQMTSGNLQVPEQYVDKTVGKGIFAQDANLLKQIAAPAPKPRAVNSDMVRVQSPEGKIGMIPKANLQKALKKGFKQIQ